MYQLIDKHEPVFDAYQKKLVEEVINKESEFCGDAEFCTAIVVDVVFSGDGGEYILLL